MEEKIGFGSYIEAIRKAKKKSLRKTAMAIGISPQFYLGKSQRKKEFVEKRFIPIC